MDAKEYDIAIIGSGPGGYSAAIKAAQNNLKVALIEKKKLGGVCLNVGCIPTKAMLSTCDVYDKIKNASSYGINIENVSFDIEKIIQRKDKIVSDLRNGLSFLLKSNKVDIVSGSASFLNENEIKVKGKDNLIIKAKKIIVATGSLPSEINSISVDHKKIFNSNSILCLKKLPKSLTIIGGGYIGCEFASFYARLGCKVTIIEALDTIIYSHGSDLANLLTKSFKNQNIEILTNETVESAKIENDEVKIKLKSNKEVTSESCLVAIGRKPNIENLNLEKVNVSTKNNAIVVNEKMQTSNSNIYAIGDVINNWMLAHVASHEGIVAVDNILNKTNTMDYTCIPAIIFTKPEIATVGLTIDQAKEKKIEIEIGKFPFTALGKAHALSEKEGFVEVIVDKKSKVILGAVAIGTSASVLISEMALAIKNKLKAIDVIDTIHAHPTLPEAWAEALLISQNTPLNFPPKMIP
ncbi:MAG: Dihydrolipoyl dehydrogenase [Candidatus Anoxychlamydiales bacterium]|nr:Dihydrolipoyl dehydrogenase [Candidatus Anoxychlamydiales bacterium]